MPYTKQTWTDEVPVSTPVRYKISESTDGDITPDAKIEVVTSITAGSPVNATRLNYMEDGIETAQETAEQALLLENADGAIINCLTNQLISNSSNTKISFLTESLDTNSYWDSGAPTRIELPYTGLYLISIRVGWASSSTGLRTIRIRKNGTSADEDIQIIPAYTGTNVYQNFTTILSLESTDYIEVVITQDSGSSLNATCVFRIGLLGKL